jgi:cytochrome oxidase assembly protein ShyY1
MHLGYAVQWFLFGAILLGGSAILAWSRRRGAGRPTAPDSS